MLHKPAGPAPRQLVKPTGSSGAWAMLSAIPFDQWGLFLPEYTTSGSASLAGSVKATLTSKRPRRQVENDKYAAFARRILRAYARRVGDGDVEALIPWPELADEIDTAIAQAVKGLRAYGYSWAEIGTRLGVRWMSATWPVRRRRGGASAACDRGSRALGGAGPTRVTSCDQRRGSRACSRRSVSDRQLHIC